MWYNGGMDGQEYLNQISAQNRPVKSSGISSILSSKFFLLGVVGVVLLIFVLMIGVMLSGGKGGEKNLSIALKLHLDNTTEIIEDYQKIVKSSELRSSSASLYSILTSTDSELADYINTKYSSKEKDLDKKIANNAQMARDELENDLFKAKIGGTLDRTYALKMAYEISLIQSEELKIMNISKSDDLKGILTKSYDSLKNLYSKFNDFSEANK